MILKKFIIKDQKELYRHKDYLFSLNLEFDTVNQEYKNSNNLDFDEEAELKEFLENHYFEYKIVEEKITDFKQLTLLKYKILEIDSSNIFIVEKNTNTKLYLINRTKNIIQILNLSKSIFKSYKIKKAEFVENSNLAIATLEILASNIGDFKELFDMLAILENQSSKDLLLIDRIKKFKYLTISNITKKQQNMFLCNCVTGFLPETKFYIKGNRIFSDYTNYFLSYEQELKMWKYLYNNRHLVGVEKKPTLNELFIGRKIYVVDEFQNRVKVTIKSAKYIGNRIKIELTNGISSKILDKTFSLDELQQRVINARD